MDIENEISALEVLDNLIGSLFGKRTMLYAREDTVHVEVEVRDATLYRVDAERIKSRINLKRAVKLIDVLLNNPHIKLIDVLLNNPHKLVAHHLSLKFVAVGTCHDTDALRACTILDYVLLNAKLLINRQLGRDYGFDHIVKNDPFPALRAPFPREGARERTLTRLTGTLPPPRGGRDEVTFNRLRGIA